MNFDENVEVWYEWKLDPFHGWRLFLNAQDAVVTEDGVKKQAYSIMIDLPERALMMMVDTKIPLLPDLPEAPKEEGKNANKR